MPVSLNSCHQQDLIRVRTRFAELQKYERGGKEPLPPSSPVEKTADRIYQRRMLYDPENFLVSDEEIVAELLWEDRN